MKKKIANEIMMMKPPYKEILELLEKFWFTTDGTLLGLKHYHFLYAFLDKNAWGEYLKPSLQADAKSFFEQHGKYRFFSFKRGLVSSPRVLGYYLEELSKRGWIDRKGRSGYYTYLLTLDYLMDISIIRFKQSLESWKASEIHKQSYLFQVGSTIWRGIYPSYLLCGFDRSQFTDKEWKKIDEKLFAMTKLLNDLHRLKWQRKHKDYPWFPQTEKQVSRLSEKDWQKAQKSFAETHLGFYWYM